MKFEEGCFYGEPSVDGSSGLIEVTRRTEKQLRANRTSDYGYGGSTWTYDGSGEHRYKVYVDADGDEYTIIDRFRAKNYQVWGTRVSANPDKPDRSVYISG